MTKKELYNKIVNYIENYKGSLIAKGNEYFHNKIFFVYDGCICESSINYNYAHNYSYDNTTIKELKELYKLIK